MIQEKSRNSSSIESFESVLFSKKQQGGPLLTPQITETVKWIFLTVLILAGNYVHFTVDSAEIRNQ